MTADDPDIWVTNSGCNLLGDGVTVEYWATVHSRGSFSFVLTLDGKPLEDSLRSYDGDGYRTVYTTAAVPVGTNSDDVGTLWTMDGDQ